MIRKMSKIDSAAKVVSYFELTDEALPLQTKQRVMRMMHYPVSLRPFMATISVGGKDQELSLRKNKHSLSNTEYVYQSCDDVCALDDIHSVSSSSSSDSNIHEHSNTPFMCTPKSFPPTPSSRANVLAKGSRFSDDVIFLARDILRLEEGLGSNNIHTKAMAKALRESRKLASFNPSDASGGISLTRGRHCASKSGNDLYASVRGMIPIPRNCYVYFEMSISTPSFLLHHASLSLGLSTLEMPLNALVGAWKSSVGLCSTSQILIASQWYSPLYPQPYSGSSTVGCLVILDDQTIVETWDGVMVIAKIVFNVDGKLVFPATQNHHLPQGSAFYSLSSSLPHDCHDALQYKDNNTPLDNQTKPVISMLVPKGEELYPTLTLHSSNTDVLCRFSSADIIAKSRAKIGAPIGAAVYGTDGSILFVDNIDDLYRDDSDDAKEYNGGIRDNDDDDYEDLE